jgi:hypothetical protein
VLASAATAALPSVSFTPTATCSKASAALCRCFGAQLSGVVIYGFTADWEPSFTSIVGCGQHWLSCSVAVGLLPAVVYSVLHDINCFL